MGVTTSGVVSLAPTANSGTPLNLKSVLKSVSSLLGTGNMTPTRSAVSAVSPSDVLVSVMVTGNRTVGSQFVIDSSMIRLGEEPNPFRIGRAVKNIQSLGIFKDVRTEVV